MTNLKLIHEDFFHQTFLDDFHGIPVRFVKNKFTGEIRICAEDVARCLGYESLNDLLSTDDSLDIINRFKKEHPDAPVFGDYGSGAMFEKAQF